ncbi:MAG TPA: aquaporin [Acidimicrobiales bacterium]|nr:aquaporin [Acidimicrobiales bacterium]
MLGLREYAAEFVGTALLLLIGLSAVCADFATQSPVASAIPDPSLRRLLTGVIFAGTATAIVYSPLGRRSGGHLNPAVTLAFLRLGKISRRSATIYVAAQIAGALTGAAVVLAIWRAWATSVRVGATVPKHGGAAAVAAEAAVTFLLVSLILNFVDRPRLMPFTAAAAGALVTFFVFVEAPVSGTSLNPARTLGPAIVGGTFTDLWIYFLGPIGGALLAVFVYRHRRASVACGKLFHTDAVECRFLDCQYTPQERRVTASRHVPARREQFTDMPTCVDRFILTGDQS